ncbi:MAG TPA: heavy metal-associated domain-containing protein [Draconibacterium sp.]|nr:heavy metal-associated domain-containing protein [Draconibacterium sp.]
MKKIFYLFVLLAFVACQSGSKNQQSGDEKAKAPVQVVETTINVGGMYCDMCEKSIEKGVNQLDGITYVKASLNDSTAIVKFDASKTDLTEIEKAIEKRGYSIKGTM